jgi:hypothetical protein
MCRGVCLKRRGPALTAASTTQPPFPGYNYAPRLKNNRYSSNKIMAPTTDMIQPAM